MVWGRALPAVTSRRCAESLLLHHLSKTMVSWGKDRWPCTKPNHGPLTNLVQGVHGWTRVWLWFSPNTSLLHCQWLTEVVGRGLCRFATQQRWNLELPMPCHWASSTVMCCSTRVSCSIGTCSFLWALALRSFWIPLFKIPCHPSGISFSWQIHSYSLSCHLSRWWGQ